MTHPSAKPLIWSQGDRTLLGEGSQLRIDPGTGPGRYKRALRSLRDSGNEMAFASFTFDPSISESVVIIPEGVTESSEGFRYHRNRPLSAIWSHQVGRCLVLEEGL